MDGFSIFTSKAKLRLEREIRKCERDIELINKHAFTHKPPTSPATAPAP